MLSANTMRSLPEYVLGVDDPRRPWVAATRCSPPN